MVDRAELVNSIIIVRLAAIILCSKAGRITVNIAIRHREIVKIEGRAMRRKNGRHVVGRDRILIDFSRIVQLSPLNISGKERYIAECLK